MNSYEFAQLSEAANKESAIGLVFHEAFAKWEDSGREVLTEGELTVLAVWTFFGEVSNGGFYQYFSNASGGLSRFAPSALRNVGLHAYAPLLDDFLALFPNGAPSEDDDERQTQVDAIGDQYGEERLEQMEDPFWDLYHANKAEFSNKLFAYVVANERHFVESL